MVKTYTKTGDKGQTSLLGGERVSKANSRVATYGGIDELNSCIGIAAVEASEHKDLFIKIQSSLFDLGALLSCSVDKREIYKLKGVDESLIIDMEKEIDKMNESLEDLKNFILPGGHISSARLHWCRTISRKTERDLINFYTEENEINVETSLKFINRLSDLFFVMARYYNKKNNTRDILWQT